MSNLVVSKRLSVDWEKVAVEILNKALTLEEIASDHGIDIFDIVDFIEKLEQNGDIFRYVLLKSAFETKTRTRV